MTSGARRNAARKPHCTPEPHLNPSTLVSSLGAALGAAAFGFLFHAQRGDLVGVGAEEDDGFVFHAHRDLVDGVAVGEEGAAGGGEGVLGEDDGGFRFVELLERDRGGFQAVGGVVRGVTVDAREGADQFDVVLELQR